MAGFGKNSGPSLPPKTNTRFGSFSQSSSPPNPHKNPTSAQHQSQRPSVSPQWGFRPKSPINEANAQVQERPLLSYVDLDDTGSRFPTKSANFQIPERTRSPPLPSPDRVSSGNLHYAQGDSERLGARTDFLFDNRPFEAFKKTRSPPLALRGNHSIEYFQEETQRPSVSPQWGIRPKSPINEGNAQFQERPLLSYVDLDDPGNRFPTKPANFQIPKRTRSPPLPSPDIVSSGNLHYAQGDSERLLTKPSNFQASKRTRSPSLPSADNVPLGNLNYAERPAISPPTWENQPKLSVKYSNSQNRQTPFLGVPGVDANDADAGTRIPARSANFQVPKRTKSPLLSSTDVHLGHSPSIQDDSEREMQAKAKRLARFNVELSQPVQSLHDLRKNKVTAKKHDQAPVEKQKVVAKHYLQEVGDFPNINTAFDSEGLVSSNAVVGLCLEMCPESERDERKRKGDLDKYERLDGDRNQTSISLAVKKYNRTAEREAELIRPMPVLQKTIDYLLGLLDQPYDDKFLGMYNFLWDRMRAIRMDLRMQHIFNQDAITMLEQMIRLHIIAMHELCEYTKGEGFSEGFDAHLNIEQMNKASVELFQLYDDHRKKGISVPSEKEFRGYYALLKLDKHPGYKVEPAELSLDLAKMPPEIRSTPEVVFARDVARACRTGNFIVFFRLARKATYLQACLMHAHFTKLRTQALASLHSGLQNNQGIPAPQVVKWLGMEGEDIESLLEYHGFLIKNFEDSYMVKDGPFLNSDMDYGTKCSQLVHLKKSRRIIDDVSFSQVLSLPNEGGKIVPDNVDSFDQKSVRFVKTESWSVTDEDMPDYEDDSTPRNFHQVHPTLEVPSSSGEEDENDAQTDEMCSLLPVDNSFGRYMLADVNESAASAFIGSSLDKTQCSLLKGMLPQSPKGRFPQNETFGGPPSPRIMENSLPQEVMIKHQENEDMLPSQNNEVAAAKLKVILRIWKRRSLKRRELREQRQMAASSALSSLSLGLPMWQNKAQWSHAGELNIDSIVRERLHAHRKSWSRLNVAEVVVPVLKERNPDCKCICWKLIACSQMNDIGGSKSTRKIQTNHLAGTWLLSKLMSSRNEDDKELVVSSSGLSIWRKWGNDPQVCCLSVIRDIAFDNSRPVVEDDAVSGASAILFLASESIPWVFQRTRLHNLLTSLPLGSSLPLLILIDGPHEKEIPDPSLPIINKLGLHEIDNARIGTFSVIFLGGNWSPENINGFLSDERLREGLKWLANQSPPQPVLREAKTRDLILSYLVSLLGALDSKGNSEVGPDDCIMAFNEALDRSVKEIRVATDTNNSSWPSPEIYLLDKSSSEYRAVRLFLPVPGWSSAARIQSTLTTINDCRLPCFAADMSWLNKGSDMGKEIQNHKSMLEKCLTWYLTQASKMMGEDLAAREASIILQTGAVLELDGLTYRIIPRWVTIFRRIFNWRLMNLVRGTYSVAYVLENPSTPIAVSSNTTDPFTPLKANVRDSDMSRTPMWKCLDDFGFDRHQRSHYAVTELTLDEMVEVSCRLQFEQPDSVSVAVQPLSSSVNKSAVILETAHDSPGDGEDLRCGGFEETGNGSLSHEQNESSRKEMKMKEADKLSMLLEQCNMLQDRISEKLAIYF